MSAVMTGLQTKVPRRLTMPRIPKPRVKSKAKAKRPTLPAMPTRRANAAAAVAAVAADVTAAKARSRQRATKLVQPPRKQSPKT